MKKPPPGTEERIAKMTFASIYPLYVAKVEKKGRTKKELDKLVDELAKGRKMEKILRVDE